MSPPPSTLSILIANGVNLDLLGKREPAIYGHETLLDLETLVRQQAPFFAQHFGWQHCQLHFYQTNSEADYLAKLSEAVWDGALLNPGAWTHTSLALADRLAGLGLPFVEVHLSNLSRREPYRQHSYAAEHALGIVEGFGVSSYLAAFVALLTKLPTK